MKKFLISFILVAAFIFASNDSFSQGYYTKGFKASPALLVIDIQNEYLKGIPERDREMTLNNINYMINVFRHFNYPIIRIYHTDKRFGPFEGSENFEFPKTVTIKEEDTKVIKTYPDGFNKTNLDAILKEKGVNTVFLCGLSAVGCVLQTWVGAQNNDYKAFLLKDAIMSHKTEYTSSVENIFNAVPFDIVFTMLVSLQSAQ